MGFDLAEEPREEFRLWVIFFIKIVTLAFEKEAFNAVTQVFEQDPLKRLDHQLVFLAPSLGSVSLQVLIHDVELAEDLVRRHHIVLIKIQVLCGPLFLVGLIVQVDTVRLNLADLLLVFVALLGVVELVDLVLIGLLLVAVPFLLVSLPKRSITQVLNVAATFLSMLDLELL